MFRYSFLLGILLTLGILLAAAMMLPTEKLPEFTETRPVVPTEIPTPTPGISLQEPPQSKVLENPYHIFQTFNNCGPAALSMALSHYGITETQQTLGQALRPYQNPQGDNDDKSVTLSELAEKAKDYDFIPYHRPNGNIELIQLFITYDIPIITRTWLNADEDIGHYRVVKGYDREQGALIQDDSLQGKNLTYSYEEFNAIWKKFNYEYLVLVPADKKKIAEAILKEDADEMTSWKKAAENARAMLQSDPDDIYTRFNLSVALYHTGDYEGSVAEFERVENSLSSRTLWYQIEPIHAYFALGNYDRVLAMTDRILNNQNRAFSELYLLRGEIYKKQGTTELARQEFERAVMYHSNLQAAKDALNSLP